VVIVGHLLTSRKKRLLFRLPGARRTLDCVIVHSSRQQRAAVERIGLGPEQVTLVPYQTDDQFWQPRTAAPKRQICSAGLEFRDYATLIEAVRGLDVEVVIAAASHWSKHQVNAGAQPLPPNIRIVSLEYAALRELYAESLFVVVPLREGENQAGITTILEAMAMRKAVVVSHTRGQTDVVRDRRRVSRTDPERPTQPDWALSLGATAETSHGQTGLYVRPGDAGELRRAIEFLLTHPDQAQTMGANGRRLIEEAMGLDHFVARVAGLIRREPASPVPASAGAAVRTL
jgi:glycosyltransferase involved in cell wall biosynthesis